MFSANDTTTAAECGGSPVVTPDSLGPIAIGATLRDVLALCPRSRRYLEYMEGDPYPAVEVIVGGATLQVMVDGDSLGAPVYRVATSDSVARTRERLGPGSRLAHIAAAYGPLEFGDNECAMYAWGPKLPGVSWGVAYPSDWDCVTAGSVGQPNGRLLPDSTRVSLVVVRKRTQRGPGA